MYKTSSCFFDETLYRVCTGKNGCCDKKDPVPVWQNNLPLILEVLPVSSNIHSVQIEPCHLQQHARASWHSD